MRRRRGGRRLGGLLVGLVLLVIVVGSCRAARERREGGDDPPAAATEETGNGTEPAPTDVGDGSAGTSPVRVTEIVRGGGRVGWSADGRQLAFDMTIDSDHYEVFISTPDGTNQRCLTCDNPDLPEGRHRGNPAWFPSGEYIIFQVEKGDNPGGSRRSTPGVGVASDLWLMTADGSQVYRLTDTPPESGVLHPQFSHDGTKLSWSQQISQEGTLNQWDLRVADFAIDGGQPRLSNERSYEPIPGALHENGGFSPDDTTLIFAANRGHEEDELDLDIYTLELETETLTQLTGPDGEWDEHAHFSPDGQHILWMSSRGNEWDGSLSRLKTDYWLMNRDGTDQRRLTHFNQPGYPESSENRIVVGDHSWSPDGQRTMSFYIIGQGLRRLFELYNNDIYRIVEIDLSNVEGIE